MSDGELEEYRTSHEQFARTLRRLMGLRGPFALLDPAYSDTVHLGEIGSDDGSRDIFLSLGVWDRSLGALLAERMLVPRGAIVFAPTTRGIPIELVHRYALDHHVTLAFLADVLRAEEGELVLLPAFERLVRPPKAAGRPFCRIWTHEGQRAGARRDYDRVAARSAEFDLFIDAVLPRADGTFSASRRSAGGRREHVRLSRLEALALAELVERGVPTRARDLPALKTGTARGAVRLVERARKKVDVRTSARYGWRAFTAIGAEQSGEQRYVFRPAPGLRYAVLS